ncbi:intradiol ring-cleavage dioxygenase [Flavobacteriaceae bacterium KMM 6897]|nr:intradiol ring-cleavage dioxygenase [Flavobacteriaceae bacterium KMM 6897]
MNKSVAFCILLMFLTTLCSCNGQPQKNTPSAIPSQSQELVGGGCDGCELMYVGMPKNIATIDTSAGWSEKGQKLLITGTVYKLGGKIPAPNVIIYYWQTDADGYYSPIEGMDARARRHGNLRGWVKTDEKGHYAIYTIRPAPYPKDVMPAHIHTSIKEPNIADEYYIDEFVFDDDALLLPAWKKNPPENRGGSGKLRVLISDDLQIAEHNIVLGLNIPNYPKKLASGKKSGLEIGEDQPSFTPFHAWGPDKGTKTCPVCKYGRYHGIVYFVGNNPNWQEIKKWLFYLEQESRNRSKYLKAYFVYGNDNGYTKEKRMAELEEVGKELNLEHLALTFVPSFSDKSSEINLNKLDPTVANTFIIYKYRTIIDKYVDLKPTAENFLKLSETLDATTNDYFGLPVPKHD